MADVRQLRWLQGWKDGHDRWSQLQDSTDFDQCILRPKDSTRFCEQKRSLQFADGNHAQAESGKGFCQAKGLHIKGSMVVHAIIQLHSQSVGWSGFCDGDCWDASPGANLFQVRLPLWTWIEVAFGVAQVRVPNQEMLMPWLAQKSFNLSKS